MELIISILALTISFISFIFSVFVTYKGEQRQKKQATLDALNDLQEQVFDHLNRYTFYEVKEIVNKWNEAKSEKDEFVSMNLGTAKDFWLKCCKYDDTIEEYRKLSGYLARIEHFSLGVNTGIYDTKVVERAATKYFVAVYNKLESLIIVKNSYGEHSTDKENNIFKNEYHNEFASLVAKIDKIENKK